MSLINKLPFIHGAKILVIDEDIHAKYAKLLVLGWLQEFKQTLPNQRILLLLFSTTKSTYKKYFDELNLNVDIEDYYSIQIHENQNNIPNELDKILSKENLTCSVVIIDCLSTLALVAGISKTSRFIEKLGRQAQQLICINLSEFGSQNVPNIETFGNIYLKLKSNSEGCTRNSISYSVTYTFHKQNGTVSKQNEFVTQDLETCSIKSCKKELMKDKKIINDSGPKIENIQATFRLNMNSREVEQKKNVNLPYVNNLSSKIIYSPDDVDDLDEEDPDDDLCI